MRGGGKNMSNIDTSSWKEFSLYELFGEPIRGSRLTKERRIAGNIPLVTAGLNNHGVAEFISNEDQTTFNSGLTIDMFGNCFYRDYEFKADDNILIFDSENMTKKVKTFIAAAINKTTSEMYSYSHQYRIKSFYDTVIKLPVIENYEPDWQYMEEYMKNIESEVISKIDKFQMIVGNAKHKIDTQKWGGIE